LWEEGRPVSKRHEYESTSELEEERRLFYVALTRAEHQAYLTYAQSRYR
jgi:superfamily I DNA/RNA helicase